MKRVSSIFSWLGGIGTIIYSWIHLIPFAIAYHIALITIPVVYTILAVAILTWREDSLIHGKKVACGIFTLIFCSLIGGILTLCIPNKELMIGKTQTFYRAMSVENRIPEEPKPLPSEKLTSIQIAARITQLDQQLEYGYISQEEYDRSIAELERK